MLSGKIIRLIAAAAAAFLLVGAIAVSGASKQNDQATQAMPQPAALHRILAHMDQAAGQVKSISAHLAYTTVTVLVNDRSTQAGELFFRKGKHLEMAIRFVTPDPKAIVFRRNKAEIYNPKTNQIQEYDLEKHANLVQEFLLLGFGSPVSELEQSYRFKYLGEQRLGGENTQALELTPLQQSISSHLTRVDLWVSEASWLPVQQEFFEPSGDYLIAAYSDVKLNPHLSRSDFDIHTSPGVQRMKMN
ncbi:MAG: LolA family protein [Terriglobia bacterium]